MVCLQNTYCVKLLSVTWQVLHVSRFSLCVKRSRPSMFQCAACDCVTALRLTKLKSPHNTEQKGNFKCRIKFLFSTEVVKLSEEPQIANTGFPLFADEEFCFIGLEKGHQMRRHLGQIHLNYLPICILFSKFRCASRKILVSGQENLVMKRRTLFIN